MIFEEQYNKLAKDKAVLVENVSDIVSSISAIKSKQEKSLESLDKMEEMINSNDESVEEIEKLVKQNDDIRSKETQLKEQYRNQLIELQQKIRLVVHNLY